MFLLLACHAYTVAQPIVMMSHLSFFEHDVDTVLSEHADIMARSCLQMVSQHCRSEATSVAKTACKIPTKPTYGKEALVKTFAEQLSCFFFLHVMHTQLHSQ